MGDYRGFDEKNTYKGYGQGWGKPVGKSEAAWGWYWWKAGTNHSQAARGEGQILERAEALAESCPTGAGAFGEGTQLLPTHSPAGREPGE